MTNQEIKKIEILSKAQCLIQLNEDLPKEIEVEAFSYYVDLLGIYQVTIQHIVSYDTYKEENQYDSKIFDWNEKTTIFDIANYLDTLTDNTVEYFDSKELKRQILEESLVDSM